MSDCYVFYLYESQMDDEAKHEGRFIRWPEHKFEIGFCVRCGQRKEQPYSILKSLDLKAIAENVRQEIEIERAEDRASLDGECWTKEEKKWAKQKP